MHSRALWGHFKPENRLAKIVRGFPCSVFLSQSTPSFLLTIAPHVTLRSIQSLVNFVLKINCAGRYLRITKTYQRSEDGTKCNKCVLLLQPRLSLSAPILLRPTLPTQVVSLNKKPTRKGGQCGKFPEPAGCHIPLLAPTNLCVWLAHLVLPWLDKALWAGFRPQTNSGYLWFAQLKMCA